MKILVSKCTSTLREQIYRMEIAPGTRLGVSEIAEQMGVSRSPVRDALMMLVNEGVVEVNSTGGYRVIQTRPLLYRRRVCRPSRAGTRRHAPDDGAILTASASSNSRAQVDCL